MHYALTAKIRFCCNICGYFETALVNMPLMILLKKIIPLTFAAGMSLFMLQTSAWGAQNTLELHSGSVKLIRDGKSRIIRTAGEKLQLLANDRLQTGGNTDISLYLRDGEDTVKLYSDSFFQLVTSQPPRPKTMAFVTRNDFFPKVIPGALKKKPLWAPWLMIKWNMVRLYVRSMNGIHFFTLLRLFWEKKKCTEWLILWQLSL